MTKARKHQGAKRKTTTTEVPAGSPAQECPQCGGLLPVDAIQITPWRQRRMHGYFGLRTYEVRRVAMLCPHCDYGEIRNERRTVNG